MRRKSWQILIAHVLCVSTSTFARIFQRRNGSTPDEFAFRLVKGSCLYWTLSQRRTASSMRKEAQLATHAELDIAWRHLSFCAYLKGVSVDL